MEDKYIMDAIIKIPTKELNYINELLKLNGDEIYQKYGLKRDETITYTATFPDGIEADIKLVICEDGLPYTEGVLFENGCEVACTDCSDTYVGDWYFEVDGEEYCVHVKESKSLDNMNIETYQQEEEISI